MILYEGGGDIPIKNTNHSTLYCNGSKHTTNNFGIITILAMETRYYTYYQKGNKFKNYMYFIVQFEDGTKIQTTTTMIRQKTVRNPNQPAVYGVGYSGQGEALTNINGKATKEYRVWHDMLRRGYSEAYKIKHPTYVSCTVNKRWHNFQNFYHDIQYLKGYKEWKNNKSKRNPYDLDKDIKVKGNKVYSKDTCMFVTQKENKIRDNRKQKTTGLTYIGTRLSDGYQEEFNSQTEFSEKYVLSRRCVNRCCRGKRTHTGGWKIEVKENK